MMPNNHCDFSPDRLHRYTLWRVWNELTPPEKRRVLAVIGLNPSTADETKNDPTIRRVIAFAKAWGFDALVMLNLFAYRATDPRVMKAHKDPVGGFNDFFIAVSAGNSSAILCAWGSHGGHLSRNINVVRMLKQAGHAEKLHCLKLTAEGHPSHPLYIPANTRPLLYETPGITA